MKILLTGILAAAALGGCAVYPAYGPPGGVYVAPAPVAIYPSYGYAYGPRYGGYGFHAGYGYRGWR